MNKNNRTSDISYSETSNTAEELKNAKSKLLEGFENYLKTQSDLCVDNVNLLEILPDLLKLQNTKGLIYSRSWNKHGDLSAFFNLERKWDRIYNIMDKAMKNGVETLHSDKSSSSTPTETFLDTIVDLGLYALMWAGYIRECYPEEYASFKSSNQL